MLSLQASHTYHPALGHLVASMMHLSGIWTQVSMATWAGRAKQVQASSGTVLYIPHIHTRTHAHTYTYPYTHACAYTCLHI